MTGNGRRQTHRRAAGPGPGWAAVLLAASMGVPVLARPALAQIDSAVAAPYHNPAGVKWGKWAAAVLAVGATALGVHQHNAGNNAYADLVGYCGAVTCSIGPDGRYVDPHAETTYQKVVRDDRTARAWIIGGQIAALGSAVLFVVELGHRTEPPNIPFNGLLVESDRGVTRVGYRLWLK